SAPQRTALCVAARNHEGAQKRTEGSSRRESRCRPRLEAQGQDAGGATKTAGRKKSGLGAGIGAGPSYRSQSDLKIATSFLIVRTRPPARRAAESGVNTNG